MYLNWDEKTITDFSESNISELYDQGYVFTRLGKGVMNQTRSLRVNLEKFEPTSENRRVLKKTAGVELKTISLPHPAYDWKIHKLGYDFYKTKFGDPSTSSGQAPALNRSGSVFSANKIKELLTSPESNFNVLLEYKFAGPPPFPSGATGGLPSAAKDGNPSSSPLSKGGRTTPVGYAICFENKDILHYAYPFYDLAIDLPNLGLGLMTKAIIWAKANGKKFVYLGSAKNRSSLYKLQFAGVEWWNKNKWKEDAKELKNILSILPI